ncbi:MAG: hypothetical protein PHU88_02230 [candidate division Zixibacteria bacterium]|nr:hypothetical protein [candidate division Zixibacteria bacterium]
MGYYLDFVFESANILDHTIVIEMFLEAGATVAADGNGDNKKAVVLAYDEIPSPIVIFKKESQELKGNWADVRLSWATGASKMKTILVSILELAKTIGCKVHDGQISSFVTVDNIDDIIESHARTAATVVGLLGRVDDKSSN